MKNILLILTLLAIAACEQPAANQQSIVHFYAPEAGSIIASDSMRIIEDELNELYYSISITATEKSNEGFYDLKAAYGYRPAQSEIRYPKLAKQIHPAIRRDTENRYSYIIGFTYEGETKFNDYAQIATERTGANTGQIKFRYIKAYYMDTTAHK